MNNKYTEGYEYWVEENRNSFKHAPKGLATRLYFLGWTMARYWQNIKSPFVLVMTGWYNWRSEWAVWSPQGYERRARKMQERD